MNREDLIMSMDNTVKNLVRKYSHHRQDDADLYQIGMMKVIEAVDDCFEQGIVDPEQIQPRANRYARNGILKEVYKKKIATIEDKVILNMAGEDDSHYLFFLSEELEGKAKEILLLLSDGATMEEVCEKMNIKKSMYYKYCQEIKDTIGKMKDY